MTISEIIPFLKGFPKRAYTVMEVRTGFATGLPVLLGSCFGAYLKGQLNWLALILFFVAGFCFNIVANTANEVRAFLAQEEDETTFTGHLGSEGLVRGDARLADAILVLLLTSGLGGISGLALWLITGNHWLLFWGLVAFLAAITYSLGPKPYLLFPITEAVSGFFVGGVSCYLAATIQYGQGNVAILLMSLITTIMTVFLMSTNNIGDIEKDRGVRLTLPHVIGFRGAIYLLIPEALVMIAAWTALWLLGTVPWWQWLFGCLIFYRQGWQRWYRDYVKIPEVYPEMGRDYGPRPLLLIYHFNTWMSILFLVQLFFK